MKAEIKSSPRDNFKYDAPKRIPKASLMLKLDQASNIKEKNKKFKDIVQKVMCKLKLEKMLHYTEEMKQMKLGNVTAMMAVNDEFLRRSLGYRKNVDHLNRDILTLRQTHS